MVRSTAFLVVALLSVLLGACCPEDPFFPTPRNVDTSIKDPAFVRIVHAAADAPAATALMGGDAYYSPLSYMTYSAQINAAKYYPADTAWKSISWLLNGTQATSAPTDLKKDHYYTAYLFGRANDYRTLVTRDTILPNPGITEARIRVVNLAPDAPPIDLILTSSPTNPVARCVAYGQASPYSLRGAVDMSGPGLQVVDCITRRILFEYPAGRIPVIGGSVMTIVISGMAQPSGNEPMLTFALFFDDTKGTDDQLYGSLPLKIDLVAIRLVNIIRAPSTDSIDLAIEDLPYGPPQNDKFRRNILGQDSVLEMPSMATPGSVTRGYFSMAGSTRIVYRIEKSTLDDWSPERQPVLSPPATLQGTPNQRYTVVAYGVNAELQVRTAGLHDNSPRPVSASNARVRFFHGGVGGLGPQQLRLRIGTATSGLQSYGEAPTGEMSFDAPSGAVTLEVLDAANNVVHSSPHSLEAGRVYTVFLGPTADGSAYLLSPVLDEFIR